MMNWTTEFTARMMRQAYELAIMSPDPSTQNGAVICTTDGVIAGMGFNRFPRDVENLPERWERPAKYDYVEHAERNAVYDVARSRKSTRHGVMFLGAGPPCSDCARAVVEATIATIVYGHAPLGNHWDDSLSIGTTILREGGVDVIEWDGEITPGMPLIIRRDGRPWAVK